MNRQNDLVNRVARLDQVHLGDLGLALDRGNVFIAAEHSIHLRCFCGLSLIIGVWIHVGDELTGFDVDQACGDLLKLLLHRLRWIIQTCSLQNIHLHVGFFVDRLDRS